MQNQIKIYVNNMMNISEDVTELFCNCDCKDTSWTKLNFSFAFCTVCPWRGYVVHCVVSMETEVSTRRDKKVVLHASRC